MNTKYLSILYKVRLFVQSLGTSYQLYRLAWFFLLMLFPVFLFTLVSASVAQATAFACLFMFAGLSLLGFLIDALSFGVSIWRTKLGKLVVGFFASLVFQLAYVYASHEVNKITSLSPQLFDFSVYLLTALSLPLVLIALLLACLLLYFFVYIVYSATTYFFRLPIFENVKSSLPFRYVVGKKGVDTPELLVISRLVTSYMAVVFLIFSLNYYDGFVSTLSDLKARMIYKFDYYEKTYCLIEDENARYLSLKTNLVAVAKLINGELYFSVEDCQLVKGAKGG